EAIVRRQDLARLRPRRYFHQQAADAHAGYVFPRDWNPGEQPVQHPVEAVQLRAACAAWSAQYRLSLPLAEDEEIARIDRHSRTKDRTARTPDSRRNDIFIRIAHRGCAENQHHVAVASQLLNGAGHV